MAGPARLVLIRHAIAVDREAWDPTRDDAERPLTRTGRDKMRVAANGLRRVAPGVNVVASSPYRRAVDTARIVAAALGDLPVVETEVLAPGRRRDRLAAWLRRRPDDVIALVGHEPDLGAFASWLLAGASTTFMPFKKGGACLVEISGAVAAGSGTLRWSLPPSCLRRLAR